MTRFVPVRAHGRTAALSERVRIHAAERHVRGLAAEGSSSGIDPSAAGSGLMH